MSKIKLYPNSGWASKGSSVTYINYPNISDPNDKYYYVDRYKYGIKFKFIISGMMGVFNINNVMNHLVSGLVLINTSAVIVSIFVIYFLGKFGEKFRKMKYSSKNIDIEDNITMNTTDLNDNKTDIYGDEDYDKLNIGMTIEETAILRNRKTLLKDNNNIVNVMLV